MNALALTPQHRAILARVVDAMLGVQGVLAIGLGGSHARGRARPDSDLDVVLLYDSTKSLDIAGLRLIAQQLDDGDSPVVAGVGEWGPWVDGGAWLVVEGQRVDLLYRAEGKVAAVLADAHAGRYGSHFEQQPPFGYFGPTLLGEIAVMQPLADPLGRLAALQDLVRPMPPALCQSIVQNCLWDVEFGLTAFVPKYVASANVLAVAGCLTRFGQALVLTLFALNNRYFVNDKTALEEVRAFDLAPAGFAERLAGLLAAVGGTPAEMGNAVGELRNLFEEVRALAATLYQPPWPMKALTA
jgi:predicted nucleotidyltransferase